MNNDTDVPADDLDALRDRLNDHRRELVRRLAAAGALDAGLLAMLADTEAGARAVDAVAQFSKKGAD
jgi:hypothetical protein